MFYHKGYLLSPKTVQTHTFQDTTNWSSEIVPVDTVARQELVTCQARQFAKNLRFKCPLTPDPDAECEFNEVVKTKQKPSSK